MSKALKQAKEEVQQWKRLYTGMVKHNHDLQKTVNSQASLLRTMHANLDNCQKAVDLNKSMLRSMSEEHSRKEQELIELLNKTKARLRELGDDDFLKELGR